MRLSNNQHELTPPQASRDQTSLKDDVTVSSGNSHTSPCLQQSAPLLSALRSPVALAFSTVVEGHPAFYGQQCEQI